jgi:hypothetical protein
VLQKKYTQVRTNENKLASQAAFADMEAKKQVWDGCKSLKAPETVFVLTRPGPMSLTTRAKVKYDGTVTPPD